MKLFNNSFFTAILCLSFMPNLYAMNQINFKQIPAIDKPNTYLVCPKDYCNQSPNKISPVFSVSEIALKKAWEDMITDQSRVKLITESPDHQQLSYEQSSLVFRFIDNIDVRFIPITPVKSTIAIFSRSQVGYYDFGVNRRRVKSWLKQLSRIIKKDMEAS